MKVTIGKNAVAVAGTATQRAAIVADTITINGKPLTVTRKGDKRPTLRLAPSQLAAFRALPKGSRTTFELPDVAGRGRPSKTGVALDDF